MPSGVPVGQVVRLCFGKLVADPNSVNKNYCCTVTVVGGAYLDVNEGPRPPAPVSTRVESLGPRVVRARLSPLSGGGRPCTGEGRTRAVLVVEDAAAA